MPRLFAISVAALLFVAIPTILVAQFGKFFFGSPAVPEVTVQQLQKLNAKQPEELYKINEQYLILDVRAPEEYQVSMIPGAITQEQFEKNQAEYRNRTIIVYCTIGYRSEKYAKKLIADGFIAQNFKGSILDWCRAGMPLVTMQGEQTNRVHTYSSEYKVPPNYTAVY
ncbi:hypothetical protein FF011L_34220 [Roseimaritima multifibrata]|uniref:Rhodanese domain-containing protein n=1 Tax=Roseimaritima multifibrata TaxID=1930274 RepID=A0A517MID2_9BACT|nr:rhodanese-like domain-containing protein [Roseimaritima multifibrata]QDS94642.1 hypothetical protein FF011L_34220 [Roseimaritima multifibrata]